MNDEVLKTIYLWFDVPWDQFVLDNKLVIKALNIYQKVTGYFILEEDFKKRMFSLRKLGQDRGGLPRLRD